MSLKKQARMRRAARARKKVKELGVHRLSVHKTPRHIYAQLFSADGAIVLAQASTLDKELMGKFKYTGNIEAAKHVGELIATRIKKIGVAKIAFDRSGYKYHGRVKALADAAREAGINF